MNYWYSYVRHSASAEDQPNSLESQRLIVENGVKLKQPHDKHLASLTFGGEFYDNDISGGMAFNKRPAGSVLLSRIKKGDAVVSAKWDRMFRDSFDFEYVRSVCQNTGVRLICLDTEVDTFTANGALVSRVLVAVATHKRDKQSEDTKAALQSVKHTKGVKISYNEPLGWMRVRDSEHLNRHGHHFSTLKPDPRERAECEEIVMRKDKLKWTWKQIAEHFNKYGRTPCRLLPYRKASGEHPKSGWNWHAVRYRYMAAKANFPCGNFDLVDGKNREQLTIEVPVRE